MPEFLVEASDIKALVKMLIDCKVERRCYVASIDRTLAHQPFLRTRVENEFEASESQERNEVELQHRDLIQALESGEDFRAELSKFIKSEDVL